MVSRIRDPNPCSENHHETASSPMSFPVGEKISNFGISELNFLPFQGCFGTQFGPQETATKSRADPAHPPRFERATRPAKKPNFLTPAFPKKLF